MRYAVLILVASTLMGGCSLLAGPEIQSRYALQPVQGTVVAQGSQQLPTIRIANPQVPAANQGNRLVLLDGNEVTYYAGQGWDADLDDMLEAALARDLATSLPGQAIATESSGVAADLEVQLDVRTWATRRNATGSAVVIEADVRILEPNSRRVLRNLPYRYQRPLAALNTAETLAGFDRGWAELVRKTAEMVAQTPVPGPGRGR